MAPLSPLPPFQLPLPLPLLLPLSPVPVRDRLPANVLVVLCACRSVGNKLSPTSYVGYKLPSTFVRYLEARLPLKSIMNECSTIQVKS